MSQPNTNNTYRHRLYDSVYVTQDGRVGIGTSQPAESLQVAGKASVQELSADAITSANQTLQLHTASARVTLK